MKKTTMRFSSLIFYSLLLLHVLSISASEISCLLTDVDRDGNNKTVLVSRNNIILKSIIQNEDVDKGFEIGGYPLHMSLYQWKTLNHCYQENDLEKISSDEIIEAIIAANKIDTTKPIEREEKSVMDILVEKAKKIVTLYDFSNCDQNYIHQIEELKKLFNEVYFDAIKDDISKNKKIINKFISVDYWFDDQYYQYSVILKKSVALFGLELCVLILFGFYFGYIESSFCSYWFGRIFRGGFNITGTLFFYNFFMLFYKTAAQGLMQLKEINFKDKKELYRFYQQSKSIVCEELDINSKVILKTWSIQNNDNKEYWISRKYNEFLNGQVYDPVNKESKYCAFNIEDNLCINISHGFKVTHAIGNNYYILSETNDHNNLMSKISEDPFCYLETANWANNIYMGALKNNTISDTQEICKINGEFLFLNNQCTIRVNNNLDIKKEYVTFSLPSDLNNFLHQKHAQIITHIVSLGVKAVFLMYVSDFLAKKRLFGDCIFFDPFCFDSFEEYDLIEKRKKHMPFVLKLFNTIISYKENFFTHQRLKHFSKEMLVGTFFVKHGVL